MESNPVILITGAAGLLGSRFAQWILDNIPTAKVIGVDDLSGGYLDNLEPLFFKYKSRFKFAKMDAGNSQLEDIFRRESITHVVHFAGYAAEGLSPFIRKFNYTNNLVATANIVNCCIKFGVKRLLFTSSMAVYGRVSAPYDEARSITAPIDPYGVAKLACELDIQIAGEQHGLDWCIIRPHNVYGRGQNIWDAYRNVIGIYMWKHLNGQKLSIYGDGTQTRAFSAINDSLKPMWVALTDSRASKQIINLGGIVETTILNMAHELIDVMGDGEIEFLPQRHEVRHAWSTWDKSVSLLGFEHKTSLHDGLKDMWEWAQLQPKRSRFVWSNYEIDNGLYSFWNQSELKRAGPTENAS